MFRPLEIFVGLRYLRARRLSRFVSFISLMSLLGVAVGVAALIVVVSVMNGFEKELRARILGAISHATIQPSDGEFREWRDVVEFAEAHPEVDGAAPYIEEGVWLQGRASSGAFIRGIVPEFEPRVSEADEKMLHGSLDDLIPGEYGIVLPRGVASLRRGIPELLEDAGNGLSELFRRLLAERYRQLQALEGHLATYTRELARHNAASEACQRLQTIPGYGPVLASAFHATVGDGARAVVSRAAGKTDPLSLWINRLRERRGFNRTVVALANKLARIGWAVLAHNTTYQAQPAA